jgi:gamma-glutamylcysteine synthetase
VASMEVTQIHFRPEQKKKLQARARANKSNVAEEVRKAVDAYLTGVTAEELELLDAATKNVEVMLAEMAAALDATNRKAERIFAEMAALHGGVPEGAR